MKHVHLFLFSLLVGFNIGAGNLPKKYLLPLLPQNAVILDAGAHIGTESKEFSILLPNATIIACEPVPNLFQVLKANTQDHTNIICVQKALSDKRGQEFIHVSQGADGSSSSLLVPEQQKFQHYFPHITFPYKIMVETITLDELAKELNLDHIDCLYLDLQGLELTVLKSGPEIMKTVNVIYTEVNYTSVYENTPLYPEVKAWMEEHGFVAVAEIMHHSTFGDVLFVRK